jgi:hypothetical protein
MVSMAAPPTAHTTPGAPELPGFAASFAATFEALPETEKLAYEREARAVRARYEAHLEAGGEPDTFDPTK